MKRCLILTSVPFLFFVFAYLAPLSFRPMLKPDEFRYAEIPREMLVSGDWISPRLAGIRYFEKPVMGYWMTAVCFRCFGDNAFALRLPSALAVLFSAAMIWLLARRKRDPLLPATAAGVYLFFGLVYGVGIFAVLDSQLAAALTLCIGSVFLACEAKKPLPVFGWLLAAGVFAGTAFLIKGFLALAIPAIVAGPYLILRREWKKLFLYPWIPLLAALAVALPWSLEIHRAEPDFWRYFFIEEHWKRFTGSTYDRDPQPFWYFIPVLLGGVMPAGFLALGAWRGWKKKFFSDPLTLYSLCWFAIPFLFFSASSCKLGTYILPCFPPLALLLAESFRRAKLRNPASIRRLTDRLRRYSGWFFLIGGVLTAIFFLICDRIPFLPQFYADPTAKPFIFAAAVVVSGGFLLAMRRFPRASIRLWVFPAAMVPVVFFGLYATPDAVFGGKALEVGLRKCLEKVPVTEQDVILSRSGDAAAVSWLLKRNDSLVAGGDGEFEYGLKNYPEYAPRFVSYEEFKQLPARFPHRGIVYILGNTLAKRPLPKDCPTVATAESCGVSVVRLK